MQEAWLAVGWIYLEYLASKGLFLNGQAKVLDVGCQHLFDVPLSQGIEFAKSNGFNGDDAFLTSMVENIASRSTWPRWEVYLSDLLQLTSIKYISFDIFYGPFTQIFDLNFEHLPDEQTGAFGVVLNFGTTEDVFNQYNSFKVIHEAAKAGGYMFHQAPAAGCSNHGYWIYSPRAFVELAHINSYLIEGFWVTGPQGASLLPVPLPEVGWDDTLPEHNRASWLSSPIPNSLINV